MTTGAIYRTLALLFHEANMKEKDIEHIERFISFISERYRQESSSGRVFIGEREITQDIKAPLVSELSSILAQEDFIRNDFFLFKEKLF